MDTRFETRQLLNSQEFRPDCSTQQYSKYLRYAHYFWVQLNLGIQLDWPWFAEWAYAGIFAVAVRIQNQDQFGFLIKKSRVAFLIFFRKVEK